MKERIIHLRNMAVVLIVLACALLGSGCDTTGGSYIYPIQSLSLSAGAGENAVAEDISIPYFGSHAGRNSFDAGEWGGSPEVTLGALLAGDSYGERLTLYREAGGQSEILYDNKDSYSSAYVDITLKEGLNTFTWYVGLDENMENPETSITFTIFYEPPREEPTPAPSVQPTAAPEPTPTAAPTTPVPTATPQAASSDATLRVFTAVFPDGTSVDMKNKEARQSIAVTAQYSVDVQAAASDSNAVVSGDVGALALQPGANSFRVTVTAEDGSQAHFNYAITVKEPVAESPTPAPTPEPVTAPEEPSHEHAYTWANNEEQHWQVCSCADSSAPLPHDWKSMGAGDCRECDTCGYVLHSYEIFFDASVHWQACSHGASGEEAHSYITGPGGTYCTGCAQSKEIIENS